MIWQNIIKWGFGVIGGLIIAWSIYATVFRPTTKPNPITTQNADRIINRTFNITPHFGCATVRIYNAQPVNSVK
jgi:hypothetical protein